MKKKDKKKLISIAVVLLLSLIAWLLEAVPTPSDI